MSEKHARGRPPMFKNVDELEALINGYFKDCPDTITAYTKDGEEYERKVPTINGLALYLGFCNRGSMYDYEKKEEFTNTIKKARARMEMIYEQHLTTGSPTGAIFALKNFGWKDKIEQDITTQGEKINNSIDYSKLDTETIKKLRDATT